MIFEHLVNLYNILDDPQVNGNNVINYLKSINPSFEYETYPLFGKEGFTEMTKILIKGSNGRAKNGEAKTLGVLGRLGGIGARPHVKGFVSDGDGALSVLTLASELLTMKAKGEELEGDVYISTHICPDAPTMSHNPVDFMSSPVETYQINQEELVNTKVKIDGILSVDTTKGNRIYNKRGFAITPTVKEGYILRVSEDLLNLMEWVTGELPGVLPITMQDITPYGNDIFHINSILQPSVVTNLPTVGIAITTESVVPGCMSGATNITDLEMTTRYILEVCKAFGEGKCGLYDEEEFKLMKDKYGDMTILQSKGR